MKWRIQQMKELMKKNSYSLGESKLLENYQHVQLVLRRIVLYFFAEFLEFYLKFLNSRLKQRARKAKIFEWYPGYETEFW